MNIATSFSIATAGFFSLMLGCQSSENSDATNDQRHAALIELVNHELETWQHIEQPYAYRTRFIGSTRADLYLTHDLTLLQIPRTDGTLTVQRGCYTNVELVNIDFYPEHASGYCAEVKFYCQLETEIQEIDAHLHYQTPTDVRWPREIDANASAEERSEWRSDQSLCLRLELDLIIEQSEAFHEAHRTYHPLNPTKPTLQYTPAFTHRLWHNTPTVYNNPFLELIALELVANQFEVPFQASDELLALGRIEFNNQAMETTCEYGLMIFRYRWSDTENQWIFTEQQWAGEF